MTRQKKEILKKIDNIELQILCDKEMGCGEAPDHFYDRLYEEQDRLFEELAHLRKYKTAWDMFYDERGFLEWM